MPFPLTHLPGLCVVQPRAAQLEHSCRHGSRNDSPNIFKAHEPGVPSGSPAHPRRKQRGTPPTSGAQTLAPRPWHCCVETEEMAGKPVSQRSGLARADQPDHDALLGPESCQDGELGLPFSVLKTWPLQGMHQDGSVGASGRQAPLWTPGPQPTGSSLVLAAAQCPGTRLGCPLGCYSTRTRSPKQQLWSGLPGSRQPMCW